MILSLDDAILNLKKLLLSAKSSDAVNSRVLYSVLWGVSEALQQGESVAPECINTLEEIFNCKGIVISTALQGLLCTIYSKILKIVSGYVVRNMLTTFLGIFNNKLVCLSSRECVIVIIGCIVEKRFVDLGTVVNDVVGCMLKVLKAIDTQLKIAALNTLSNLVSSAGGRISEHFLEIAKNIGKLVTDKCVEIRYNTAKLLANLAAFSVGCTIVPADVLMVPSLRGLEDEVASVQEKFSFAVATIYNDLYRAFVDEQEKAKVGLARGGAQDGDSIDSRDGPLGKESGRRTSLVKFKDLTSVKDMLSSANRKVSDEYDFRSIVRYFLKQTVRVPSTQHRAAYLLSLQYFIQMNILSLDFSDCEWLLENVISSLRDATILSLSYEDIVYYRTRLAHMIRSSITSMIIETDQLKLLNFLAQLLSGASDSSRTEHELQLALGELGQVIASLAEACVGSVDAVEAAVTPFLRNSSFGVRASAAHVLVGLACVTPNLASRYFQDALQSAKELVSVLLVSVDGSDLDTSQLAESGETGGENGDGGPFAGSDGVADSLPRNQAKKSTKDSERLQRMFAFHGNPYIFHYDSD